MKHLALLILLVFISCKTEKKPEPETTTENQEEMATGIENSVAELWKNYVEAHPESKDEAIPDSDFFHNNREDANRLAELTLMGKKRASSGLYSLYQQYDADLPQVSAKQIVTDFDGKAMALIENVSVDTIPFNKISKEYAELDMGTAIEPLEKWKKAHWDFFETFLKESGGQPTEDMLIVCVRFEKIWPQ